MKRALILALFLGGCASQPVVTRPIEVMVPVPVPCKVPNVEHPAWPTSLLRSSDTIFAKVKALLSEIELRKSYEAKLEAAANSCK